MRNNPQSTLREGASTHTYIPACSLDLQRGGARREIHINMSEQKAKNIFSYQPVLLKKKNE